MEIANLKSAHHIHDKRFPTDHRPEPFSHSSNAPIPPHERKGMLSIRFDEMDMNVFKAAFANDDEATAAMEIAYNAFPEIQILIAQTLSQIKKELVKNED